MFYESVLCHKFKFSHSAAVPLTGKDYLLLSTPFFSGMSPIIDYWKYFITISSASFGSCERESNVRDP